MLKLTLGNFLYFDKNTLKIERIVLQAHYRIVQTYNVSMSFNVALYTILEYS